MSAAHRAVDQALGEGVVTADQALRLKALFIANGIVEAGDGSPENNDGSMIVDSEAPRFLRGFHDILITIGVVTALSGLWGVAVAALGNEMAGPLAVLLGIIPLAEFLVRRQRLALPAFALTVFAAVAGSFLAAMFSSNLGNSSDGFWRGLLAFAGQMLVLAPFYRRYRVPAALAALIVSVFGLGWLASVLIASGLIGQGPDSPQLVGAIGLVFALGLFSIAMRDDQSDLTRVSRRSDVAFWLHLVAAPALLYSTFIAVLGGADFNAELGGGTDYATAIVTLAIVAVLMLIGIAIDRRAFVTAGLASLGGALYALFYREGVDFSGLSGFVALMVGATVLMIGTGWNRFRKILLGVLPASLQLRLPPVKA